MDDVKNNMDWENQGNSDYYENIPIEELRNTAKTGGFEEGCDIDVFYPRIVQAKSIIEVGAAYGRVLAKLIKNDFKGEIYAVERSKNEVKIFSLTFKIILAKAR